MRYSLFEYTRTCETDYLWKVKPELLSSDFNKVVQQFIYMRDELRDDDSVDWSKIMFFLKYGDAHLACQIISNGQDYIGRPIYSMRGLVSESHNYRALLGIPDVITRFYTNGCPSADADSVKANLNSEVEYNIEDEINPLIPVDKGKLIAELDCSALLKLLSDIRLGQADYAMIVGPDAEIVYRRIGNLKIGHTLAFDTYYDFNKFYDVPDYSHISVPIIGHSSMKKLAPNSEDNKAILYLKLIRDGKTNGVYEWILQRQSDGLTIRSSKRKFVNNLTMDSLLEEEKKIKRYYSMIGFEIL